MKKLYKWYTLCTFLGLIILVLVAAVLLFLPEELLHSELLNDSKVRNISMIIIVNTCIWLIIEFFKTLAQTLKDLEEVDDEESP